MKLISFDKKKNIVKLFIESSEDLWVLYNLIDKGDIVFAKSLRRVKTTDETARSSGGERKPVFLGVKVEDVSFHGFKDRLRIKGKIVQGPEDLVKIGSYHTFNIDFNQEVEIHKSELHKFDIERINDAIKNSLRPRLLVCAIDSGESTLAILSEYETHILARITENIPGKRVQSSENIKLYNKFYKKVFESLKNALESYDLNYIVIAGPGFTKEHFLEFILKFKPELKNKIIVDTASSGDVSAVNEVIRRGAASKALLDLKAIENYKLINELLSKLSKGDRKVTYGFKQVKKAAEIGAVEVLMITDELLRSRTVERKKELYKLIEEVENTKGKIRIISLKHEAGEILKGLGGIAAILRFKIT